MTFDLRDALLRKQEFETARLDDFEFRLRGRRIRLLAEWLQARLPDPAAIDPAELANRIADKDDHELLRDIADLALRHGIVANEVMRVFERCAVTARKQLITERGDPTPHRLA